jgi:hypothetical protein
MSQPEQDYQNNVLRKYALAYGYHSSKEWGGTARTKNGHLVSGAANGMLDLILTGHGRAIFVEVKAGTKASPAQEDRMKMYLGDDVETFISSPRTFKWDIEFLKMKKGTKEYWEARDMRELVLGTLLRRIPLPDDSGVDMDYFKAVRFHVSRKRRIG